MVIFKKEGQQYLFGPIAEKKLWLHILVICTAIGDVKHIGWKRWSHSVLSLLSVGYRLLYESSMNLCVSYSPAL